jgi:hypothetical protein
MENENVDLHFDFLLPALLYYCAELDVTNFTSSLSQPEIFLSPFQGMNGYVRDEDPSSFMCDAFRFWKVV